MIYKGTGTVGRTANEENVDELCSEQVAAATQEGAVVGAGDEAGGGDAAVCVVDEVLGGEEAGGNEAPGTVPAVDSDGVQGVVKVQPD